MSIIDKMDLVSEETILNIKNKNVKSESEEWDFKEIYKIKETVDKIELVKDIAAFANSKGGYIIYGVNKSYEWVGLDSRSDIDVDEATIHNILDTYCDGKIDFVSSTIEIDDLSFFVLYIFQSKDIIPFKKDGQYNKEKWGKNKSINTTVFKKGDVYWRKGSRSIKADSLYYRLKSNNFKILENVSSQPIMYTEFIGRKEYLRDLYEKIKNPNNRIIQIDGIGGIGKTSFVHYFVQKLIENDEYQNDFDFIIWTSSKRNKYTPKGIKDVSEFISNYADLIQEIVNFIEKNEILNDEDLEYEETDLVKKFLQENKVLLIVDNLETLNDNDLIDFLEHFPTKSKAILTTRETLGDFYMSRINMSGFSREKEFEDFLVSQYTNFNGQGNFLDVYKDYLDDLYSYTKGMPLACQLITHQLANGIPINNVFNNLKSGKAYEDILTFCFKGSIERLSEIEKTILFILSLSEKESLLSIDDLIYVSGFTNDEIGMGAIPKLTKISLCYQKKMDTGTIGYSIPYLAKIYSRQFLHIANEQEIISKYEVFVQERAKFNSLDSGIESLFYRSQAKNHNEKVLANDALKCLSIASYDYYSAIDSIDELIQRNSKFPFLYLIKGKIEENSFYSSSLERAKKEFLIAIELNNEYLEALIELGYIEYKLIEGNKHKAKEYLQSSINYFQKAYKISPNDQRVCLGLAQGYSKQARHINYKYNKETKIELAEKANEYFEKSFYKGENLTKQEKHSNAITACGYATNLKRNRDNVKALDICLKGLEYEPDNHILLGLKRDIEYYVDPKKYVAENLKDKGWVK